MPASMKDFKVLAALGKGSYGSVMKVERIADGMTYAVKEVNIRRLSPREREDALNEIRILASIKHRNIVRYCDAFTEKDNLYIVMEFAEGGDIGRQVEKFKKANKYIKEDHIWSYVIQMCRALHELHSRSVLHRDIKPKNVFLTGKNHIRLGDLGCAKLMKTGLARTQIGTPYYMSPEIWANRPYDGKSDMWAMGCLLYEMAMLQPPFLASDMNGLALKVKTTPATRISKHYSDELAALVASLLSKDPKVRPDAKSILMSPAVLAKLHLVPEGDDDGGWMGDDMRSALLATIRVPTTFGYGIKPAALALPGPAYPILKRMDSASSVDAAPAAGGAGAVCVDTGMPIATVPPGLPTKPASGIPPAAPATGVGRVAAFAAATSPPQLGRYMRREGGAGLEGENVPPMAPLASDKPMLARAPSAGVLVKPLAAVPSARNLLPGMPAVSAPVSCTPVTSSSAAGGGVAAPASIPPSKPVVVQPTTRPPPAPTHHNVPTARTPSYGADPFIKPVAAGGPGKVGLVSGGAGLRPGVGGYHVATHGVGAGAAPSSAALLAKGGVPASAMLPHRGMVSLSSGGAAVPVRPSAAVGGVPSLVPGGPSLAHGRPMPSGVAAGAVYGARAVVAGAGGVGAPLLRPF